MARPDRVASEDELLAVVHAAIGREGEDVLRFLRERVDLGQLDERVELAVALVDEERQVVPAVLADQPLPLRGRLGRRAGDGFSFVYVVLPSVSLSPSTRDLRAPLLDVIDDEVLAGLANAARWPRRDRSPGSSRPKLSVRSSQRSPAR